MAGGAARAGLAVAAAGGVLAAAAAPWVWARLAGVGLVDPLSVLLAFELVGFRTGRGAGVGAGAIG
jgi:hypothetical protein